MPVLTTNYSFNKPNVNSADDEDLWGDQLNNNWESLDTLLLKSADISVTTKSADYTVQTSDRNTLLAVSATAGDVTLTLPAAATAAAGFKFLVEKTDVSSNKVIVDADASETIDGLAAYYVFAQYEKVILICDGTGWRAFNGEKHTSGMVSAFAANSAPNGWLECDGSAVSRTVYERLFNTIGSTFGAGDGSTTFNLPDLRGEFVRGWDNGKGTDSGRAFGSSQSDAIGAHTHTYDTSSGTGGSADKSRSADNNFVDGKGTTDSTGGDETRPRNIALMYCIKA